MSRLSDLGKAYYEVDNEISTLNEKIAELKTKRESLREDLVNEMAIEDLPEFAIELDGVNKRFALKKDQYASYTVENKEAVFDAFRKLGLDGIIKEDIHGKTLNSTIRELTNGGETELPDELKPYINIFEKSNISITTRR